MNDLNRLFSPGSIALVGASQDVNKIRGRMVKLLIDGGFRGPILPVNPGRAEVQGLRAYPSLRALPVPVDLAVIAVPAEEVMGVLEDAHASGIKAAVIFTAGATDAAPGEGLEHLVGAFAARTGMRILGPNAEGFVDTVAGIHATFSPTLQVLPPPPGGRIAGRRPVSIVSQSGALAFGLYSRALNAHVPIRHLVSTGNEADVDLAEVVDHLIAHAPPAAILLFLEGLHDADAFVACARRAADAGVPLIVAKVGTSQAGQRAAISHTAHLAGADAAYDAVFRRYGVIRVASPDEMIAVATLASAGALPAGDRLAIVTSSGGAGGWAADLCEAAGLSVPPLDAALKGRLRDIVPAYGSTENPVDVTAAIVEDGGRRLLRLLAELGAAPGIDICLVILSLVVPGRIAAMTGELQAILEASGRPVVFASPGTADPSSVQALATLGSACMELAAFATAMSRLVEFQRFQQRWQARRGSEAPAPGAFALPCLPARGGPLGGMQTRQLLLSAGMPLPPETLAGSAGEAVAAAQAMGLPVALKVVSPSIPHKTEAGGLALGLADAAAVAAAHARILRDVARHAPHAVIEGIQVQKMMPPGREMVVGVVDDADFGPLLMLGLGGIHVEVLRDVVFAPVPVDAEAAHDMIRRLRGRAILDGVRGEPPADLDALARLLVDLSRMVAAAGGAIAEIDLNPVILYPQGQGCAVVDALVVLRDGAPARQAGAAA